MLWFTDSVIYAVGVLWNTDSVLYAVGLLWNNESPRGELALPYLCPGHPPEMPALPEEGWCHEADSQRHQVGPCELCALDPRGEFHTHFTLSQDSSPPVIL